MNQSHCVFYSTLGDLSVTAQQLLQYAGRHSVWLLEGSMGAGKTTLVRALCEQLGVQDHVASPTFSLVHEYALASGALIYHFDLYRVRSEEEVLYLDFAAYFDSGRYCFVEWPEKARHIIPSMHCKINFDIHSHDHRILQVTLSE